MNPRAWFWNCYIGAWVEVNHHGSFKVMQDHVWYRLNSEQIGNRAGEPPPYNIVATCRAVEKPLRLHR